MSPEQRDQIDAHLQAVHKILIDCNQVRGGDWSFIGWTAGDERKIKHKFKLDGIELTSSNVERDRIRRASERSERVDADPVEAARCAGDTRWSAG